MIAASIDHGWNSWVLAYGTENQARFFQWLGVVDWQVIAAWVSNGLIISLLAAAWFILPKRRNNIDPAKRIYHIFLKKLAVYGIIPQTGEGPVRFSERVCKTSPELAKLVKRITQLYVRIRYEPFHDANDLHTLIGLVKRLPKPRHRLFRFLKRVV